MDSLGSLALATEPPYEELLQRAPTKRNESMINGRMWKHIIIQSLCQIILLIIIYLYGPEFIKEENMVRLAENKIINYCYSEYPGKDINHIIYGTKIEWVQSGKIRANNKNYCGKYMNHQKLSEAYEEYLDSNYATVHMTMIFNIFVFYTLLNQINCRVIDDSFNILVRINRSSLFIIICLLEMALQVAIIFIGKSPIHIVNGGLSGTQWGICIGLSAITFVISFIVKLIPIHICIDKYLESKTQKEEEKENKEDENQENKNDNDNNDIVEIKQIKFQKGSSKKMIINMSNTKNNKNNSEEDNNDSLILDDNRGAGNTDQIFVSHNKD